MKRMSKKMSILNNKLSQLLNLKIILFYNSLFKFDLNLEKIQTKLYKKLTNKAKELMQLNKQVIASSKV